MLVVYGQVAGFAFVNFDDTLFVTENPIVRTGLTIGSLRWALTTGYGGNWMPLTWFSHLLDVQLFGVGSGRHHLVSLLLHLGNTLLLFRLLAAMTGNRMRSVFVAALFAVHPLNVEAVAWIAQRRSTLMMFFGLLALHAWIRYARRPSAGRYLLAAVLFALGLLAKSLLVPLPLLLLLLDFWPLRRQSPEARVPFRAMDRRLLALVLEKLPLLVLSAAAGLIALRTQAGAMTLLPPIALGVRLAHALVAYVWYFGKALRPAALAVFYPYPPAGDPVALVAGSAALLVLMTVAAHLLRRLAPYLLVGWLWFLVTLLPVIGLVQVGEQAFADRYAYLPLIGLFIAAVWAIGDSAPRHPRSGPVFAAGGTALLLALAGTCLIQVRSWADGKTLFLHALAVTGGNYVAHNNLGSLLLKEGDLDGAAFHFRESLRSAPGTAKPHRNLGLVHLRRGRLEDAVEELRRAVSQDPSEDKAFRDLGQALDGLGRPDEALAALREAYRINPRDPRTAKLLGGLLLRRGDPAGALAVFEQALALDPSDRMIRVRVEGLRRR